ncbi:MAG: zinc ribbon domain-containing protein [Nitrososphaeraceae archaeon]
MNAFDKGKLVLNQLKWLAVYIGSAFVISILFPFPIDWFVAIPVFLLISLCRRGLFLKKLGIKDRGKPINISFTVIKNFFKPISANSLSSTTYSSGQVKYYCMSCGNEHREIACPKCGSKMKRVG